PVNKPTPKTTDSKEVIENKQQYIAKPTPKVEVAAENVKPKIVLNRETKRTSGLSLKSIRAKKEHEIKQMEVVVDEENLPREAFSQDELTKVWNTFVTKIEAEGKMNLAAILSIDKPTLKGTTIHLTFPNATNKVEVERQSFDLLQFLRKTLKNYDISLGIDVNEEMQKKFAYTPDEKYEKLKEKNPNIELLRKTFDLDL
ncbi:MAG: DNA polymerase III subunit gamma/tau, partial [Lacinutrix venerupis]